jgi:hypothetical protein
MWYIFVHTAKSCKFFFVTFSHIEQKILVKVFLYMLDVHWMSKSFSMRLMFIGLVNSDISLNWLTSSSLCSTLSTPIIFCFLETTMCFSVHRKLVWHSRQAPMDHLYDLNFSSQQVWVRSYLRSHHSGVLFIGTWRQVFILSSRNRVFICPVCTHSTWFLVLVDQ